MEDWVEKKKTGPSPMASVTIILVSEVTSRDAMKIGYLTRSRSDDWDNDSFILIM